MGIRRSHGFRNRILEAARRAGPIPSGSLIRTIIGYAPANIIPAFGTLATIVVFTRLLAPREFGYYAIAQACYAFGASTVFSSLQFTVIRFSRAGQPDEAEWLATAYRGYLLCSVVTIVLFVSGIVVFVHDSKLRNILWVCLLAVLLRGAVMVNVAIHRRRLHSARYNLIECLQPFIAFVVSVGLIVWTGMGAIVLLWGMVAATFFALIIDMPLLKKALSPADKKLFFEMARYGLPLGATYALSSLSAYADRVFLLAYLGTAAVGIFGIGFNLVDRATSLIFISISIGALPVALISLDREGAAAARLQMARIGRVLLALGSPAATGLACCSATVAAVLVGDQYRAGVAAIIPWLCFASLLRGLSAQYFEYAYHLGKRTHLSLLALIPAACLNVALNAILVPAWGMKGALIADCMTQLAALVLNAAIGRRAFRLDLPLSYASRIGASLVSMCAVLLLLPVYHDVAGLFFKIAAGAASYLAAGFLLSHFLLRTSVMAKQA